MPLQTLKGFRDVLPADQAARDYVSSSIRRTFKRFGYAAITTPTIEYSDVILGKYGDEADKLVFSFTDRGGREVSLRYDQTVPTARFLANNQSQLPQYFRRYQIQNVFRADKPQKGRYREFTQCDCDIFGSTSPVADAEILAVFYQAYADLGLKDIQILINDRQTLIATLQPLATNQVSVMSIIQSIDKLDKQPLEEVAKELIAKGLTHSAADQALAAINKADKSVNLRQIEQFSTALGVPANQLVFQPTLARGLDYYTGLIFEAVLPTSGSSSLGGGGRYDQLIEQLANIKMPAVGFGIGFDRTVEVCQQQGLLPSNIGQLDAVVITATDNAIEHSLSTATKLRNQDLRVSVLPTTNQSNLGKQLQIAEQQGARFAIIIGEDEAQNETVTLKNLASREQVTVGLEEAVGQIKANS